MPIELFFNVADAKGDVSRVTIPVPDGTALTDVVALVPDVADLLQALSTGGMVSAGFTVEVDVSSVWGPVAQAASDVQEKAEFAFRTVNGFIKRLNVPAVDEAIFDIGSASVDQSNAAVAAFVTFMEDGLTPVATLVQPVDSRGEDLVTLVSATENWGKRRR